MYSNIPEMLTVDEISARFKVARHFVYQCVKTNRVIYVKAGVKFLINAQKFADFLNTGENENPSAYVGKIRGLSSVR